MTTARRSIEVCDYLRDCAAYGEGIRILRQDKWEALCSFIISQCNNIPRIKGIVEKLCSLYGDAVEAPWGEARSFPSADAWRSSMRPTSRRCTRATARPTYSLRRRPSLPASSTSKRRASCPAPRSQRGAQKLNGVGDKVANCVVLFGLHQLDAFPVDVWIKRALAEKSARRASTPRPSANTPGSRSRPHVLSRPRDRLGLKRARCDKPG